MADSEMNIYEKLSKIRKMVEVVQKNKAGYGYKYVTDDELLAKITGGMEKYGVSLIPGVVGGSMNVAPFSYKKTKKDKVDGKIVTYEENVNEVIVTGDMMFTWVNNSNPEDRVEVPWVIVGHQADASQSFGSGLTYSMRYFLLKYFSVATPDDDPDRWRSKQKASEKEQDKILAEQIISQFDSELKEYISKNPEKAPEAKAFVGKYIKGGNYFNIAESSVATKMLEDFRQSFITN